MEEEEEKNPAYVEEVGLELCTYIHLTPIIVPYEHVPGGDNQTKRTF